MHDLTWVLFACGAAWVASDAARRLAQDVDLAIRRAGLTRKQLEDVTGLNERKLSDCLTCKAPLNLFRLADLPDVFWRAFDEIRAERAGRLLLEKSLVRLVVHLDKPRMARMTLATAREDVA